MDSLRGLLVVAVAEVAWNLIEDGIPEDIAIADAMEDSYRIPLDAPDAWTLEVMGLVPGALLPREERWLFERDVLDCIRGEFDDVGSLVRRR